MAENVTGESSAWSEVSFIEPVTCLSEGLYVLFRFPVGSDHVADGAGGGAAVGYTTSDDGFVGWISEDGEDWAKVHDDFGFAVVPIFIDSEDGMMEMDGGEQIRDELPGFTDFVTALEPAVPNPFNPQTTIRFSLRENRRVNLTVFNLKGERIKELVDEYLMRGGHSITWKGQNESGKRVSSGIYFVKLVAGKVVMSQRLVLIQ